MALECKNCGAFYATEDAICPYCFSYNKSKEQIEREQALKEAEDIKRAEQEAKRQAEEAVQALKRAEEEQKRQKDTQESLDFLRTIKPSFDGSSLLKRERFRSSFFKTVLYPLGALLLFAGVFLFMEIDNSRVLDETPPFFVFIVPSLVIFFLPKLFKAESVDKRMTLQLNTDGFNIISMRYVAGDLPSETAYFIKAQHNTWIVWKHSGNYTYHSRFEVAKVEEVRRFSKNSSGYEVCNWFSLQVTFKDNRHEEIVLIHSNKPYDVTSMYYKDRMETARIIKEYLG